MIVTVPDHCFITPCHDVPGGKFSGHCVWGNIFFCRIELNAAFGGALPRVGLRRIGRVGGKMHIQRIKRQTAGCFGARLNIMAHQDKRAGEIKRPFSPGMVGQTNSKTEQNLNANLMLGVIFTPIFSRCLAIILCIYKK